MKYLKFLILLMAVPLSFGAQWSTRSFLNNASTNSATAFVSFYGTTNTTTFAYTDSYNTNRVYYPFSGSALTVPLSTNSITGEIAASYERGVPVNPVMLSDTTSGAAITVRMGTLNQTNVATLTFIRSSNGGQSYDLTDTFSFSITPAASGFEKTIVTNVPTSFLNGASHIRWYSLVAGTNSLAGSGVYLTAFSQVAIRYQSQ